jgi:hypothetical protein
MPLETLTRDITANFGTDVPVEANAPASLQGNGQNYMLYVTRTSTTLGGNKIGTFQHVTPAGSGDGFLMWDEDQTAHLRLHGAMVDPAPVNGHTYRLVSGSGHLMRYNDDDHMGDRHRRDNPWSIIGGMGTQVHPYPTDSPVDGYVERQHYVEVTVPDTDDRSSAEEEVTVPVPVEVAPNTVSNTLDSPVRGLAVTDENGRVALNPERVIGRDYLLWDTDNPLYRELRLATFTGPANPEDATTGFICTGAYYNFTSDAEEMLFSSSARDIPTRGRLAWAELALVRHEPDADERIAAQATADRLRREARELGTKYEEFNEALNQLAKEKSWCGEYEDIITPLDMRGRNRNYDVEVSVNFSFDLDSPSSRVDSAISTDIGMTIEASSLRVSASLTVTINNVECNGDTDNMSEYISTSDVEEAVDNMLSGVSSVDVDDWSVEDWSESDS